MPEPTPERAVSVRMAYAELVPALRRRGLAGVEAIEDDADLRRLAWAMAESRRRAVRLPDGVTWPTGSPRGVTDAFLDPSSPAPPPGDFLAWSRSAQPAELLPPRPPAWPGVGFALGGALRALRSEGSCSGWLRVARWALDLGHVEEARFWSIEAARRVETRDEVAAVAELQGLQHRLCGRFDAAERAIRRALRAWPARAVEERANTMLELALLLRDRGRLDDADAYLGAAEQNLLRAYGDDPNRARLRVLLERADVALRSGAEPVTLGEARRDAEQLRVDGLPLWARLLQVEGFAAQEAGEPARVHFEQAAKLQRRLFGADAHAELLVTLHGLGSCLQAAGEPAPQFEANRALVRRLFGQGAHPLDALALHQIASRAQAEGKLEEAAEALEQVLAQETELFGGREHPSTAITEMTLGLVLVRIGRRDEALALLRHCADVLREQLGEEHPHSRHAADLLGAVEAQGEDEAPNIVTPFVLHALATSGGLPLRRERLRSLAFRQLLYERAMTLMPVLQAADLAALPGSLTDDPASLPAPAELAARLKVPWPELLAPVVEMHRQFTEGFARLMPATRGLIDPGTMDLTELEDGACVALIDEALAVAVRARKTGDGSALASELDLWIRAGLLAIRLAPRGVGTALPVLLLQLLPEGAGALLAAWGPELSPEHLAAITPPASPVGTR